LIVFLCGISLFEMAFFSMVSMYGGSDETYGVRYFLESVPFITILAVYAAFELIGKISNKTLYLSVALFVMFTWFFLSEGSRIYSHDVVYRKLPLVLAASLILLSYLTLRRWGNLSTILYLLISMSVAYGFSMAYADFYLLGILRRSVYETCQRLESQIQDDSAVFYSLKGEAPYVSYVKLFKKTRMVSGYVDRGRDTNRMLMFYNSRNIPIYINMLGDPRWVNETINFIIANNMTNVYYVSYSR
jgi:hypothetical protein